MSSRGRSPQMLGACPVEWKNRCPSVVAEWSSAVLTPTTPVLRTRRRIGVFGTEFERGVATPRRRARPERWCASRGRSAYLRSGSRSPPPAERRSSGPARRTRRRALTTGRCTTISFSTPHNASGATARSDQFVPVGESRWGCQKIVFSDSDLRPGRLGERDPAGTDRSAGDFR